MAKPEWGLKRTCQACGARFYDLMRTPAVCPKCQTEFDAEAVLKTRRLKATAAVERPVALVKPKVDEFEDEEEEALVDDEAVKEEDEAIIEDTSELGEDTDDMAEVIENVDDDEER